MLKINDRFYASRDTYGWRLTELVPFIDKEQQEKIRERHEYYPRLGQVLSAAIDKEAGQCEDLSAVKTLIDDVLNRFTDRLEKLAKEVEVESAEEAIAG